MTRAIPVQCEEVEHRGRYTSRMEFIIPSMAQKFTAEFVPSKTATAIRRLNDVVALEVEGAPRADILAALEKFLKPAKTSSMATVSEKELQKFKLDNGWTLTPVSIDPAPGVDLEAPAAPPVITSDGRYIVDPATKTVTPVDELPADIVAVMPIWVVEDDTIAYEPRQFDIAPGMETAFQIEHDAAAALLTELGGIIFGAVPRDLEVDSQRTSARLIDGGTFIRAA